MDDLLSIGRFARLAGLSVGALRHYDELDLLRPARIDPVTGYRSYRRDQLETAAAIVRWRDLEVPLESIRDLLATDDPGRVAAASCASTAAGSRPGRSGSSASCTSSASSARRTPPP